MLYFDVSFLQVEEELWEQEFIESCFNEMLEEEQWEWFIPSRDLPLLDLDHCAPYSPQTEQSAQTEVHLSDPWPSDILVRDSLCSRSGSGRLCNRCVELNLGKLKLALSGCQDLPKSSRDLEGAQVKGLCQEEHLA